MVPLVLGLACTAADELVEFVNKQVDRLVAVVGDDRGIHVGAMDFDMALRREALIGDLLRIALEFHADAHDALLMSEQALHLLLDERLDGRGQLQVNA